MTNNVLYTLVLSLAAYMGYLVFPRGFILGLLGLLSLMLYNYSLVSRCFFADQESNYKLPSFSMSSMVENKPTIQIL